MGLRRAGGRREGGRVARRQEAIHFSLFFEVEMAKEEGRDGGRRRGPYSGEAREGGRRASSSFVFRLRLHSSK